MASRVVRPPGPPSAAGLNALFAYLRDPLQFLAHLGRDHGDVSFARVGLVPCYMLNHPALVEEALIGRYQECSIDSQNRNLVRLMGQSLLTLYGEPWRRDRKLMAPALQPRQIAAHGVTIVTRTNHFVAAYRDGEVRDVQADVRGWMLDIACRTLLGLEGEADIEAASAAVLEALSYYERRVSSVEALAPDFLPTPARRRFDAAVRTLSAILGARVAACRALGSGEDVLSRMARARDENGFGMSDQQLRDEGVTLLVAGHETTALAVSFALLLLAQHPEALARARQEVDVTLGRGAATVAALRQMPFVGAVLRETLRLYPPLFVVGREVVETFELGGYEIPKGSELCMSPFVMHRDARFHAEPERFLPERSLEADGATTSRFSYFPFGGGPKTCIGNHFATMTAGLVLATLLQKSEFETMPGFELKLEAKITLRAARGVRLRMQRRVAG